MIASGAISFSDNGLTSTGGQQTIDWTYDPNAADLDWLREGDTLTLTYTAQINDGAGKTGSQDLVITISGTNDVPTIDSATNPATIDEIAGDSSAQNIPATTGTITFTDQDLGDSLSFRSPEMPTPPTHPVGAEGTVPNDPAVNVSALIASGAISFSDNGLTSTGGQQTIDWTYDPNAADLDWLREGDTLTLTYTAQINDGAGKTGSQDLVITISGTNDVPTIDSATNPATIDEIAGDSSAQNIPATTGTITFTDQDLGDSLSLSVTGDADATYTPSGGRRARFLTILASTSQH